MQQNHMIALGALAVLGGLAWYQKRSATAQAASVTQLGQQSTGNFAANLLNSLAPTPPAVTAKAAAAPVLDSNPVKLVVGAGPAPVQQTSSAPRKLTSAEINEGVNRIGVADDAAVFKLADWGRQNNVTIGDFSAATGYLPNDVANVFAKRGILYGF